MTYSIIQWATGAKGMVALQEVIRHPDLNLVGLRVYGDGKVGRDAGDIAGTHKTGVIATDDVDQIVATPADCVIYCAQNQYPFEVHTDAVCKLLASGKNVVALTGFFWPDTHGKAYVERLEAACQAGQSTLFGTGFSPGFFSERMGLQITEASLRVDSIHYLEVCDCSHNHRTIVEDVMGCGKPPTEVSMDSYTTDLTSYYHYEVLDAMASALGVTLDDKQTELERRVALKDEVTPAGILIKEGTVGATVRRWIGIVDGKPFITCESRWTVVGHIPGFEPENLWQITVEGRPAMQMQLRLGQTFDGNMPQDASPYPTFDAIAAPLIRAVPLVCKAPPGIMRASVFAPWTERMR